MNLILPNIKIYIYLHNFSVLFGLVHHAIRGVAGVAHHAIGAVRGLGHAILGDEEQKDCKLYVCL